MGAFQKSSQSQVSIVVWVTSWPWSEQFKLTSGIWENIIWTSSKRVESILSFDNKLVPITEADVSLDLSSRESISKGIEWLIERFWDKIVFADDIHLTFHAMTLWKIDHNYPQIVTEELKKYVSGNIHIALISYERDSHVAYGAREVKDTMEASLLWNDVTSKTVVDLLVFDSKSAKVLGPTFLWVVGDFINFLESDTTKRFTELKNKLQKFLWGDYWKVQDFFKDFPIRWRLKQGQKSMKDLSEGEFNQVKNRLSKDIDFAELTFISGLISQFYLERVAQFLEWPLKEGNIKTKNNRILLDWETLGGYISSEQIENFVLRLEDKVKEKEEDTMYVQNPQTGDYEFNPKYLNIIDGHFWIIPLMLQHNLVLQTLEENEYIAEVEAKSQMYTGTPVKIRRHWNEIKIENAENSSEVFSVIQVSQYSKYHQVNNIWYVLPSDNLECDIDRMPHRDWWKEKFLRSIPNELVNLPLSKSSTAIEHLGFRIGSVILNNPDFFEENFRTNKETLWKMKGMFQKVEVIFESPDFEQVVPEFPEIRIVKFSAKEIRGNVIVMGEAQILDNNGEVLAHYKLRGM